MAESLVLCSKQVLVKYQEVCILADLDADLPPLNSLRPYIPLRRPRL